MKKLSFVLLAFALCFASCSKNDSVGSGNEGSSNDDNDNKSVVFKEISAPKEIYPIDSNNTSGTVMKTNIWEFEMQVPYNVDSEKPGFVSNITVVYNTLPNPPIPENNVVAEVIATQNTYNYNIPTNKRSFASYSNSHHTEQKYQVYESFGVLLKSNKKAKVRVYYDFNDLNGLAIGTKVNITLQGAILNKDGKSISKLGENKYTYNYVVKPRSEMPKKL